MTHPTVNPLAPFARSFALCGVFLPFLCLSSLLHGEVELEPFNPKMHAAGKAYYDYLVLNHMPSEAELGIRSAADFANVVYIDPSAATAGNGATPETALNSWLQVTWSTNTAYLQKRGTEETLPNYMATNASNILLGAYGEGPRPIIQTYSNEPGDHGVIRMQNRTNITVRDIHTRAPNLTALVKLGHGNITLYNNRFEAGIYGIRGHTIGTNFRIIGNIIHNIRDDAVFLQYNDKTNHPGETEVAWNHFYDLNTAWKYPFTSEQVAHGDAIQFEPVHGWHAHHNVMDRSTTSQKFAVVSNAGQGYGILEHNYIIGPNSFGGGAAVYFGPNQAGFIVRYNIFAYGELGPLYSHCRDLQVYGNIFYKHGGAINLTGNHTYLYNNAWWDHASDIVASAANTRLRNNIIDNRSGNRIPALAALENNLFTSAHADIVGKGTGNIILENVADIGLFDPGSLDFRVMLGSPVIDAGVAITDITLAGDRMGTPIPQGAAPDIGPHEFTGALLPRFPGVPANLAGTVAAGGIKLSWNAVNGAESYRVMRYEGPQRARYEAFFELDSYASILGEDGAEGLVLLGTPTTHSFTDTDAKAGHLHYYVVSAVGEHGEGLYGPSIAVPFVMDTVPPNEWAGYPIDEHGWVDTGSWLFQMFVQSAPWLYNPLIGWMWMAEEQAAGNGAWFYVLRP